MSEHIKTTYEVVLTRNGESKGKQWVSLSWLKEQIKNKKHKECYTLPENISNCVLDWVLSLLEVKQ